MDADSVFIEFDDRVSVKELFALLKGMEQSTTDRFPARDVFHLSLRDEVKEQEALNHTVSVTARDRKRKNELVGYLRLLTDHAYMFYILDVMVNPGYRGRGIGRALLDKTVEESKKKGFIKIFLTAIPGTEGFYRQFGFQEGLSPVLTMRGEDHV